MAVTAAVGVVLALLAWWAVPKAAHAWRSRSTFINWSGTVKCKFHRMVHPRSVDDVVAAVKEAAAMKASVKVVGSKHSFSPVASPDDTSAARVLMSLRNMDTVTVDAGARTVTAAAGASLKQLCVAARQRGLALHTLPELGCITVGGVLATGTHGSSPAVGCMASLVTSVTYVTASGAVMTFNKGTSPEFDGAVISLGCLGVLVSATLQAVPAFRLEERLEPTRLSATLQKVTAYTSSHHFFKFIWLPFTDTACLYRAATTTAAASPSASRWLKYRVMYPYVMVPVWVLGTKLRFLIPAINRLIAAVGLEKPSVRVADSHRVMALEYDEDVKAVNSEWSVPLRHVREAVEAVKAIQERSSPACSAMNQVSFIAGDSQWLSTTQGEPVAALSMNWYGNDAMMQQTVARVTKALARFGGRPHWGKFHNCAHRDLAPLYPRMSEFKRLRARMDPHGMFLNTYVREQLGLAQA